MPTTANTSAVPPKRIVAVPPYNEHTSQCQVPASSLWQPTAIEGRANFLPMLLWQVKMRERICQTMRQTIAARNAFDTYIVRHLIGAASLTRSPSFAHGGSFTTSSF